MADEAEHRQLQTPTRTDGWTDGRAGLSQQLELALIACSVVVIVKVRIRSVGLMAGPGAAGRQVEAPHARSTCAVQSWPVLHHKPDGFISGHTGSAESAEMILRVSSREIRLGLASSFVYWLFSR